MTMDADMTTGVGTATEIPMKTGLSTMDIPITGMTNTPVSKWETKNQRYKTLGWRLSQPNSF